MKAFMIIALTLLFGEIDLEHRQGLVILAAKEGDEEARQKRVAADVEALDEVIEGLDDEGVREWVKFGMALERGKGLVYGTGARRRERGRRRLAHIAIAFGHQCQRQGPYEAPEALQRLSARVFRVEGSRQAKKRPTKFLCRFSGTRGDWTTRLRQSRFIGMDSRLRSSGNLPGDLHGV